MYPATDDEERQMIRKLEEGSFDQEDVIRLLHVSRVREKASENLRDLIDISSDPPAYALSTTGLLPQLSESLLRVTHGELYPAPEFVVDLIKALRAAGYEIDERLVKTSTDDVAACMIAELHGRELTLEDDEKPFAVCEAMWSPLATVNVRGARATAHILKTSRPYPCDIAMGDRSGPVRYVMVRSGKSLVCTKERDPLWRS